MAPENILALPPREIESDEVWVAARVDGLYSMRDDELAALIARHDRSALFVDQVRAEAARHIRRLRRGMAAGRTCY
jgi:hypothetical protein